MELSESIVYSIDSGLAQITLNRKQVNNALDPVTIDELTRAFRQSFSDSSIRAVLLKARGPVFCAGMDLSALAKTDVSVHASEDPKRLRSSINRFSDLIRLIVTGPKAVVAAVTGDLRAGGVGLAGACDLVYALDSVETQLGEIVFGLIPANIMAVLVGRRISHGTYRRWALTAETADAAEAMSTGLFDGVYANRDALEKAVRGVMKRLYRAAPAAVARLKTFMDVSATSMSDQSKYARQTLFDLASDPATIRAVRAMNDGELPEWFGKFKPESSLIPEE